MDMTIIPPWPRKTDAGAITIGLLNNMPGGAMATAEWQFRALLEEAAGTRPLRFRFFTFPQLGAEARHRFSPDPHYEDLHSLWDSKLDALIVTGTEPKAASMIHEPYWPMLANVINWSAENTVSTVWSCLAAHAAVLHIDGIARVPFAEKLSGVFQCTKAMDHELLTDLEPEWLVPHSRWNGLDETALVQRGYDILSRSQRAGVDMFAKAVGKSLFLMFQGHPEYDSESLFREYRRDVKRFVGRKRATYPEMPEGYFADDVAAALDAVRSRTLTTPGFDPVPVLEAATGAISREPWRAAAVAIYARWLAYVADHRSATAVVAPMSVPEEHRLIHS